MKAFYIKLLAFFNLTPVDVLAIFKGAVIAGLGAALTVLLSWATHHNFGPIATPIITAIAGVIVNMSRKSADGPVQKATGVSI